MKRPCAIIFPLVLLCLWIAGCTPASTREALARADSIMAAAPDSALAILDALDPATLNSDETRAIYAVSLTEARHMAYVPVYDDSLITMGADYYLTHGSSDEKARAFYYSAIVRYNNSNYEQAIVDGLRAEKHAITTSDHLRLGLIYRTIADCFRALYDWSSALHYYRLSYQCFNNAPDNIYTDWALLDLSSAEQMNGNYENGIKYINIVEKHAKENGDTLLLADALRNRGCCFTWQGKYNDAISCYESALEMNNLSMTANDYGNLGQAYVNTGEILKAKACLDSLRRLNPEDMSLESIMANYNKDFESAYRLLKNEVSFQNSEVQKFSNRNYARTITEYFKEEETAISTKLKNNELITSSIIIISFLAIISLLIIHRYRSCVLRQKMENSMFEARDVRKLLSEKESYVNSLQEELTKNKSELADALNTVRRLESAPVEKPVYAKARNEIKKLLSSRFEILDRLCDKYFQFKGLPNKDEKITKEVMVIISEIQNDDRIQDNLEKNSQ